MDSRPDGSPMLPPRLNLVAFLLAAAGSGWWVASCKKETAALPAVGTAEVLAETMVLYSRADSGAPPAAGLIKGDRVQLLAVPEQPGQEWIPAQLVKNHVVSEPGFARTAELGNWSGDGAEEAFRLLLLFARPAPGAAASAVRSFWTKLEAWERQFGSTPGMGRLSLELAREYLFWAAEAARSAELDADRPRLLEAARKAAARGAGAPGAAREAAQIEALARRIEAEPPPAAPPASAEPDFSEVRSLWGRGEYQAALQRVDQILAANPGNAQAMSWKSRLQAAIEAERALSR